MRIRASTRLLAVVGDPVAHSLSPAMHNAAIAALGLDAVYLALRAPPTTFAALVRELVGSGGGANVTIPHKRAAARLVDHPSDVVRVSGACNTVWPGGAGIAGDNTDVAAVAAEAVALLGGRPARRALVLGTGGAARAAALALARTWPDVEVVVRGRSAERGAAFARWAADAGIRVAGAAPRETAGHGGMIPEPEGRRAGPAGAPASALDLVVNATPLGMRADDPLPIGEEELAGAQGAALLDFVYAKGGTRLVAAARALGLDAADGRGMLVAQGAEAFQRFFGVAAPVEVMRAAVEDALAA
jgi:shikimate dehydrogenase